MTADTPSTSPTSPADEAPATETLLSGGIANVGQVVRVGDTVRRPRKPQNDAVHDFLRHLRACGVLRAPEPLGFDGQGREVLAWIEGFAAEHPHPDGIASDDLLVEVATLQRDLQLAAASFEPPADAPWNALGQYFPAGSDGPLVCHNDLSVANLILTSDGGGLKVVGVIDFDYSHPVNPLFDLAVMFRHWGPVASHEDLDPAWSDVSPLSDRLALFGDVHELSDQQQIAMLDLCEAFLNQARKNVRSLADAGHAGFRALIDSGYEAANRRSVELVSALRSPNAARPPT